MDQFNKISAEVRAIWASLEKRFNAIQSPTARIVVMVFTALIMLMVLRALLPWLGLLIIICVIAILAKAFWPKSGQ